jgi:hypothetical protein
MQKIAGAHLPYNYIGYSIWKSITASRNYSKVFTGKTYEVNGFTHCNLSLSVYIIFGPSLL